MGVSSGATAPPAEFLYILQGGLVVWRRAASEGHAGQFTRLVVRCELTCPVRGKTDCD